MSVKMKAQTKRKPGRPKGSKNKPKKKPWGLIWFLVLVAAFAGNRVEAGDTRKQMVEMRRLMEAKQVVEVVQTHQQQGLWSAVWDGTKEALRLAMPGWLG